MWSMYSVPAFTIVRCLLWIIYLALSAITIANYRLIVIFEGLRIWDKTSEAT